MGRSPFCRKRARKRAFSWYRRWKRDQTCGGIRPEQVKARGDLLEKGFVDGQELARLERAESRAEHRAHSSAYGAVAVTSEEDDLGRVGPGARSLCLHVDPDSRGAARHPC